MDPLSTTSPSLTPYHYVRNNPLFFLDPDGIKEIKASNYARNNLIGLEYAPGITGYPDSDWQISNPNQVVCNEFVAIAYREAGHLDFPVRMDKQVEWFLKNGWFSTDINSGEVGDVLFFGDINTPGKRHEVMIVEVKIVNGVKMYRIMGARNPDNPSTEFKSFNTINSYETKWFKLKFYGIGSVKEDENNSDPSGDNTSTFDWRRWIKDKWGLGPSPEEMWHSIVKPEHTNVNQ